MALGSCPKPSAIQKEGAAKWLASGLENRGNTSVGLWVRFLHLPPIGPVDRYGGGPDCKSGGYLFPAWFDSKTAHQIAMLSQLAEEPALEAGCSEFESLAWHQFQSRLSPIRQRHLSQEQIK